MCSVAYVEGNNIICFSEMEVLPLYRLSANGMLLTFRYGIYVYNLAQTREV